MKDPAAQARGGRESLPLDYPLIQGGNVGIHLSASSVQEPKVGKGGKETPPAAVAAGTRRLARHPRPTPPAAAARTRRPARETER